MNIFIRTFGCTVNQSDSEVIAGLLTEAGYKIVSSIKGADLVLFNTCTVKDSPEKRFFSELGKALEAGKKVVVAGCIPQADPDHKLLGKISLMGVDNIGSVADIVERTAKGDCIRFVAGTDKQRLNLPKTRKNHIIEIIPVCAGCLGNCSYCKTKFARGNLRSYSAKEIKKQFKTAINEGIKEIWLTSQDNGAYGKDIKSSLPVLLKELLSVRGNYRIRIGMINPNHALEFIDELIEILKHPNVFKFVHLPVQSGSNKVLKDMSRMYSAEQFVSLIEKLRKAIPMITIATDVIAGYPTEADDNFDDTYALLKKLKIPVINITKFFSRPGTPANGLKPHANKVSKNRTSKLARMQSEIINNNEWLGWKGSIIIDEKGKNNSWVGRNDFYKPIVIKKPGFKIGEVVNVKVIGAEQHYLEGEPYEL